MGTPKVHFATSVMDFPVPEPAARALSEQLCALIRTEIEQAGGRISFSRFMELALYAPGLGYYVAGARKFGEAGDFVTAPELGDLFAQCLARQCAQVLSTVGGDVVEFGAGSGRLASDLLTGLETLDQLPTRYRIVELSPELQQRQRETLREQVPHLLSRIEWIDRLPASIDGVIVANEVADAMPAQRFRVDTEQIWELAVTCSDDKFIETEMPASAADAEQVRGLSLPPDYICELHTRAQAWLQSVAERLSRGVLLVIDYGFPAPEYYHPQRNQGTLMCHYRHRAHGDPYLYVGLQDITMHLDFSALARSGEQAGLEVLGYTQQGAFLMSLGLLELVPNEAALPTARWLALTQQVRKLTLPSEMGELFKVLALGRGIATPLAGFALLDHRDRL